MGVVLSFQLATRDGNDAIERQCCHCRCVQLLHGVSGEGRVMRTIIAWLLMNTIGRALKPLSKDVTKRDSAKEVEEFEKRRMK
jgi:hypothetical protein